MSNSNIQLTNFQKIHHFLLSPPEDSIVGWGCQKIHHLKKIEIVYIHHAAGFLAKRALAVAMPFLH